MEVGDKVWIFDGNHRVYTDPEGNKLQSPWYRGHFVNAYVWEETKQSWLICRWEREPGKEYDKKYIDRVCAKYKKQDAHQFIFTSEEEIDRRCWVHDNDHKIAEKVRRCNDYEKLKQIEAILTD